MNFWQYRTNVLLMSFVGVCLLASPGKTNTPKYFCGSQNNLPITFVRTTMGDIALIRWISHDFLPQETPLQRCERASLGLQRAYDNNALEYLQGETLDGQPVICTARSQYEDCTTETVIVNLTSTTDPNTALALLLDLRRIASESPLHQSGSDLLTYVDGDAYSRLDSVLSGLISIQFPETISDN